MSSPYDTNPDRRPLPVGWITQYDSNYNAWFYVNTEVEPPLTTWNHPLGPASVSPPPPERKTYSPPAVPPNNSSAYASGYGQGGYPSQGGGNSYPQLSGGYGDTPEYQRDYPQQNGNNQRRPGLLGRLLGGGHRHQRRFGHEGRFGGGGDGYMGGGGYPSQQQVYVEQQHSSKRPGLGMGLAAGGLGGLLGGVLLGEAIEDHRDENRDDYNRDDYCGDDYNRDDYCGDDNRGYDDDRCDRDDFGGGGDFF